MRTVILIDDEPGVVLALKLLLQTTGYKVESFTEPQKALDFIYGINKSEISDKLLVLSDLRMPNLTGFDVLEKCKSFWPELEVIVMSGHAEDEEIQKALSLGAKAFLSKPFSPSDLKQAIG